jgi:hypothetical protein
VAKIMVDGGPWRIVLRQEEPGTVGAQRVENAVDGVAELP